VIRYEFIPVWLIVFAALMIVIFSAAMMINFFIAISFYKVYVVATLCASAGSYCAHKYWP